jgi:cytidylate kinase
MAIIAISRQMGSGGYIIAQSAAKALGYEYADREIIMRAAKAYEVPEAEIAKVAERQLTGWQRFDEEKLRYRTFLDAAYYAIAEKDNVVTAGRGIVSLVRGVSHALRIRIIAPFETRVERIQKKDNLDHAHAAAKIREYDREITARIAYLFGPEWAVPENYDLVINTVREDPTLYTDMVIALAAHPRFQATPQSLQHVKNLSLAAQVRAAIAKHPHTRSVFTEVTADKGHVTLKGTVRYPGGRESVAEVARSVPGVASVSADMVEVSFYNSPAV